MANERSADARDDVQRCREEARGFRPPTTRRKSTIHGPGVLAHTVESAGERSGLATFAETAGSRPFHKRAAGCTACPRCWRAEEPLFARCDRSGKRRRQYAYAAPRRRRDARANPAALPSPARAAVVARASAALSEIVQGGSAECDRGRHSSACECSSRRVNRQALATGSNERRSLHRVINCLPAVSARSSGLAPASHQSITVPRELCLSIR